MAAIRKADGRSSAGPAERRHLRPRPLDAPAGPPPATITAAVEAECEHKKPGHPPCRTCAPLIWRAWCVQDERDETGERAHANSFHEGQARWEGLDE